VSSRRRAKRYVKVPIPREKEVIQSPGGWAYDPLKPEREFIYELTLDPESEGHIFTCFDGKEFFTQPMIEQHDSIITPPPEEKVTWSLPLAIQGEGNPPDKHPMFARMIWDGVESFTRDHLVLQDKRYYTLTTAWTIDTYFQDVPLPSSPYLYFLGLKKAGKTRAEEVLGVLCFRAKTLGGISGAAIRTNVRLLQPTLLIDEQDLEDEEKRGELMPMLLSYRPGQYVERKDPRAKGWDQLVMDPAYCWKAIASRKPPGVNLEDRCIIVNMIRAKPKWKLRKAESQRRATELRTQLLELRMRHFHEAEQINEMEMPDISDDRIEELFLPLYGIAKLFAGEEEVNTILELAKEAEQTAEDRAKMTDEHDVVAAIVKLKDAGEIDQYGFLPTSRILEQVNDSRSEGMEMSAQYLARLLESLGFKRKPAKYALAKGKSVRCAVIDRGRLEHYRKHFGIKVEEEERVVHRNVQTI